MFSNRDYDLADRRFEEERAHGLRQVQAGLSGAGADQCVDCEDPIDPARRKAMPNACRCADCQTDHESKA